MTTFVRYPPNAGDLAACGTDAFDRFAQRLDCNRHVKSVGVDHGGRIANDRNVAAPEDEISARKICKSRLEPLSERELLHVAIPRTGHSACCCGKLHQAGAVYSETCL